jgi:MFS family permease
MSAVAEPFEEERDEPPRPGLREAFVAFRSRNFSLFFAGALLSNIGTWMQNIAVPVVLFEMTHSATWLGFASFLQFGPMVLMGPLAGSLADRFQRRKVLMVSQTALAVLALLLFVVWQQGWATPGVLVAIVAASGFVGGLNLPSWQAFVTELVPREALLNAVTLNSAQFNAARAVGPALGGLALATVGPGFAFLLNFLSYGAVLGALVLVRVKPVPRAAATTRILRQFTDAVRYTRRRPGIAACIVLICCAAFLGNPVYTLLAVFKDRVFHVGDGAYGLLGSAQGAGAVLCAPFIAGRGSGLGRGRLGFVALLAYGGTVCIFGLAPTYAVGLAALLAAGGAYLAVASTLNTAVQLQVDEEMRGKVLALYLMTFTAAYPLGSLIQGWLAEHVGARTAVAGAGALLVLVTLVVRFRTNNFARLDDERAVVIDP